MKKVILSVAIFSLFILNACGGKELADNGTANANVNSPNAPIKSVNGNEANVTSNENVNVPGRRQLVESNLDPNVKPKPVEVAVAFDSTMSTTMDKQGKFVETRTFKNNPQISKIERRVESKQVKLYLKSGKTVDLPYDQVGNLFINGSPESLLQLAGIKPPPTPSREDAPKKQ
jgi:hypothetical protein